MVDECGYVLLTDQPWTEGADPLGFDDLAERLAGLVLESRTSSPLTIGLLGGRGSGKSSLMSRLQAQLKSHEDVDTVWFNAWTAEGKSVLEGMIKSVLAEIGPEVLRRTLRRRRLVSGLRLAATLGLGWFGAGRLVDQVWEAFSADARTRNELPDLLREAMKDWRSRRRTSSGRLLVVFVDDLDRCSPANVIEVFEAVKLYLDARGFIFVIGYDDRMVARALDHDKDYELRVAAQYLEKIVQIEYRMPWPDDIRSRALIDALVERSRTGALLGEAERALIADRTQRNPRRAKRFLNSFVLARRLDPAAAELPPREFILLRLLALSFPGFYQLLLTSTERDAISEFFAYAQVYDWVERGPATAPDEVRAVFDGYQLERPDEPSTALDRLSRVVSEEIPPVIADRDLRALLSFFPGDPDRTRMLEVLRRSPPSVAPVSALADEPGDASATVPTLYGASVLWIDDNPENNRSELAQLEEGGVRVATATTLDGALRLWRVQGPFDLVISDVARHGDPDAGFHDLAALRARTGWQGPAVFYGGRVTPERRERAEEVHASITRVFSEVWETLSQAVHDR